jgi:hypothetical protein
MKVRIAILIIVMIVLVAACRRRPAVCEPGSTTYVSTASHLPPLTSQEFTETLPQAVSVVIGGKTVAVDRIVNGPLCNDSWSGTVYVACDLQIVEWDGKPTFLKDCAFSVEPGSTVYVAAHNDTAYYKGCSCHTGELAK